MRKLLTKVLLLSTLLTLSLYTQAVPENNPPTCPPHDFGSCYESYPCQVSIGLTGFKATVLQGETIFVEVNASLLSQGYSKSCSVCGKCGYIDPDSVQIYYSNCGPPYTVNLDSTNVNSVKVFDYGNGLYAVKSILPGEHSISASAVCSCRNTSRKFFSITVLADSDFDGVSDDEETERGTNPNNPDTDNDGIIDGLELKYNLDPQDPTDADADADSDGLSNIEEINTYNTDPTKADTDSDGLNDYEEINTYSTDPAKADTDSDGIDDGYEIENGLNPLDSSDASGDFNNNGTDNLTEYKGLDSDGDGLSDYDEIQMGTDIDNVDTDGDHLYDEEEVRVYNTSPSNSDSDNDGLDDGEELKQYNTDPNNADTDGDGIIDGLEVKYGLNPNDATDAAADNDGDTLSNIAEINTHHTNPNKVDTDGDTLNDNVEVNIYGTNPNNADTDGDNLNDNVELDEGYNPLVYTKFVYVNVNMPDSTGDGLTLSTAKKTINEAIAISQDNNKENVILVSAGVYKGDLNKNLDFQGFNIKLRSIAGAQTTVIDLEEFGQFINLQGGENQESWVDGFTIRNGLAIDGGAICTFNSGLIVKNCIFDNNQATDYGGAIMFETGSSKIINCTFSNNKASHYGAIIVKKCPETIIKGCTFYANKALVGKAGAIFLDRCNGTVDISESKFIKNNSVSDAGGLYVVADQQTTVNLTNCLFLDNKANSVDDIYADCGTSILMNLKNITVTKYSYPAAVSCRFKQTTTANIKNCIIQGEVSLYQTILTANYNCSQTNLSNYDSNGIGNITVDPQLTPGGYLKASSPCIDAGNNTDAPTVDMDGVARPVGANVDMGCYELSDTDGDGMPDGFEQTNGLDPNSDDADLDKDNDGLSNYIEYYTYGSKPNDSDSDDDGWSDGEEFLYFGHQDFLPEEDHDQDGFTNIEESLLELDDTLTQETDNNLDLIIFTFPTITQ